jgi:hypothetical protein
VLSPFSSESRTESGAAEWLRSPPGYPAPVSGFPLDVATPCRGYSLPTQALVPTARTAGAGRFRRARGAAGCRVDAEPAKRKFLSPPSTSPH